MRRVYMYEAGWLKRQLERAVEDIKKWPDWKRRDGGWRDNLETGKEPTVSTEGKAGKETSDSKG
jgi:hypothetical protein